MRFLCITLLILTGCSGWKKSLPASQENYLNQQAMPQGACTSITDDTRKLILQLAAPEYFQKTRYRKGPRYGRNIEKEADCSSFVHEVYRRSGLPFSYRSSRDLKNAPEFQIVPEEKALPGDLMVFRGHVGIVAEDGKIISATSNRHKRKSREPSSTQASSVKKVDRKFFRGERTVLRYKCTSNDSLAELK